MIHRILPAVALSCALALPAQAQAQTDTDSPTLMEEGARMFLRGLITEMEPALDDLRGLAEDLGPQMQALVAEMGPALADLLTLIDDVTNYAPPEVMPNGDIIIRRKPDAPEYAPPPVADDEGGIDL